MQGLSLTGKRWHLAGDVGAGEPKHILGWVLAKRGILGDDALRSYLAPSLATLDDPSSMADMPRAVDLLCDAVRSRAPIVVYGDYDVDGVSSTSVLVDFLRQVGAAVDFYIPDRRSEGYGLNLAAVEKLASSARVLITTDCGITAHREIARAKELGCQVVIVDHHTVPEELPSADACLNPQRKDCAFPFKSLCATGVAFMLVVALRRALRESGFFVDRHEPDVRELLDIVAVATVADMVPMRGLNRMLVATGLKRFATSKRAGLIALCEVADVDRGRVTATDLGFRIAPRINARGRLSHASAAVDLLLTNDHGQARELAGLLDTANRERKELERATTQAALERAAKEEERAGVVLYDPNWHPGVLGLVATRLTQTLHKPAIVIGEGGKGSGRTIAGMNLHQAIAMGEAHLLRFGGHAAAAGVTIAPDNVEAFREAFCAAVVDQLGAGPYVPELTPDLELSTSVLSLGFLQEVEQLEPFGQENPEPLWVSRGVPVREHRKVGDNHLKLVLGGHDAIAFGMARLQNELPPLVDVAYRVSRNVFRGRESLQLRVEDLRAAE